MFSRKCFELATMTAVRGYKKHVVPTLYQLKDREKRVGVFLPQRSAVIEWDFDREVKTFCKRFGLQPSSNFKESFLTQNYIDDENANRLKLGLEALSMTSNAELAEKGLQSLREVLNTQIRECYPKLPEQGVEAVQKYLCSSDSLLLIANEMGLEPLVLRSGDSFASDPKLLRDTLLALFACVENQSEFCQRYVLVELVGKDVFDLWHPLEVSLMLNSVLKNQNQPPYEPRLVAEAGRNTLESVFYVAVYSDKKFLGKGAGETQAAAIDMAVRDALKREFGVTRSMRSPFETMSLNRLRQQNAGLTPS